MSVSTKTPTAIRVRMASAAADTARGPSANGLVARQLPVRAPAPETGGSPADQYTQAVADYDSCVATIVRRTAMSQTPEFAAHAASLWATVTRLAQQLGHAVEPTPPHETARAQGAPVDPPGPLTKEPTIEPLPAASARFQDSLDACLQKPATTLEFTAAELAEVRARTDALPLVLGSAAANEEWHGFVERLYQCNIRLDQATITHVQAHIAKCTVVSVDLLSGITVATVGRALLTEAQNLLIATLHHRKQVVPVSTTHASLAVQAFNEMWMSAGRRLHASEYVAANAAVATAIADADVAAVSRDIAARDKQIQVLAAAQARAKTRLEASLTKWKEAERVQTRTKAEHKREYDEYIKATLISEALIAAARDVEKVARQVSQMPINGDAARAVAVESAIPQRSPDEFLHYIAAKLPVSGDVTLSSTSRKRKRAHTDDEYSSSSMPSSAVASPASRLVVPSGSIAPPAKRARV